MDTTSHTMGEGGLARLAQSVLAEWQGSHGAAAEEVEFCEECGGFCGDLDPEEREMAEQWAAWLQHPFDEGVWLGNVKALDDLPQEITAVVSLCLTGTKQVPAGVLQVPFRLIDEPEREANLNLELVIIDAARTVADLRAEGHHVLIHCVAAESRTPTVGIAYATLSGVDVETATKEVRSVLPAALPNCGFSQALGKGDSA